jgi:hypothetical protein
MSVKKYLEGTENQKFNENIKGNMIEIGVSH